MHEGNIIPAAILSKIAHFNEITSHFPKLWSICVQSDIAKPPPILAITPVTLSTVWISYLREIGTMYNTRGRLSRTLCNCLVVSLSVFKSSHKKATILFTCMYSNGSTRISSKSFMGMDSILLHCWVYYHLSCIPLPWLPEPNLLLHISGLNSILHFGAHLTNPLA